MDKKIIYTKLVTGEDIISEVLTETMNDITLVDPLQINIVNYEDGATLRLTRWIPHIDKQEFLIGKGRMIVTSYASKDMAEYYLDCVESLNQVLEEHNEEAEDEMMLRDLGKETVH